MVGLEIKDEFVNGDLRDPRHAALPIGAAVGGMAAPASLYLAVNLSGGSLGGWGVPVATDIAFALGVLALIGDRVPQSLKVFLLALAIADDVGAVLVIALFYSRGLSIVWLGTAVALLAVIAVLRWLRVWYVPAYVLLGSAVWLATFESGVHATTAGVALGLLAPARPLLTARHVDRLVGERDDGDRSTEEVRKAAFLMRETAPVTQRLRDALHPWTSYLVIPLFALANAGITFDGSMLRDAVGSPVTLGIALGLLLGKPLGILGTSWLLVRTGTASLPTGTSWRHVAGAGAIAGIGFTMSLFIAGLAFPAGARFEEAKLGIFTASMLAAAAGTLALVGSGGGNGEGDDS